MMMPFFNRNWAGACWGRWAGPGLLAGWSAGSWIVGAEVELLQCWSAGSGRGTPLQKQERTRVAPMPKSIPTNERKDRLLRGRMLLPMSACE